MKTREYSCGTTLMELLMVAVMLSVLAAIAVPIYKGSVEEARSHEAKTNIMILYRAEKAYYRKNGKYFPPFDIPYFTVSTISNANWINTDLNTDIKTLYYDIAVGTPGCCVFSQDFIVTATRTSDPSKQYTIVSDGTKTPPGW